MSFFQSGLPEKSSPSHQTVPASSASRSVSPILGNTAAMTFIIGLDSTPTRKGLNPNSSAATTKTADVPIRHGVAS